MLSIRFACQSDAAEWHEVALQKFSRRLGVYSWELLEAGLQLRLRLDQGPWSDLVLLEADESGAAGRSIQLWQGVDGAAAGATVERLCGSLVNDSNPLGQGVLCNPLSLDVLNGWDAKHNTLHQRPTESHGFSTAKPPEVANLCHKRAVLGPLDCMKRQAKVGGNALAIQNQANAILEQQKDMPTIPPGIDRQEFLKEVAKHTMRDDWSCAAGPPKMNDEEMPGLRYGASLEIRPKLLVLPCPCPGGSFNKAWRDSSGSLQPSGLWARWPKADAEEHGLPALFPTNDGLQATGGSPSHESGESQPYSFNALGGALKGAVASSVGVGGMYHPGGEPYSADYGCLKGFKMSDGPMGGMQPGKRWWNMPDHTEVAIATPCPCMLGTFDGDLQPKVATKLQEALSAERGPPSDAWDHSIDDRYSLGVPKVPAWQTSSNLGWMAVLLATLVGRSQSLLGRERNQAVLKGFL
ncbi:unnamed protein product [Durusdinium trenchii]|uniref:Uncharacterized protein n=1 Tax=Durusdinium trenchii TaxID=1381693 RepID=A0ABP0MB24_9DINO